MERTKAEASIPMTMDNTEPYICTSCPTGPKRFSTEYDLRIHESLACFHCEYCSPNFRGSESEWESRQVYHLASAHKCGEWNEINKFDRGDHFGQLPIHSRSGTNGPRMEYPGNFCRKEKRKRGPDPVATTTTQVSDIDASHEAYVVSSNETSRHMNNRNPRSESSVHSRASQQSTPSTGSQVSDGSIEAGHSVFHAMDDLIEEHLKEAFPKLSLMAGKKTTPANESYKTAVRTLLHKIHKRYPLLYSITDVEKYECHENLVVLYDDMKLAFMPQVLVARGSEEAYTELTLQISEFSYRLDQCMGLEPDEADTGYASMQEEHRTWPSQLTHDKNKYKGSKRSFKMMLSRKKPRNSLKASFLSVWRKWSKLKAAGGDKTDLNVPEPAASEIGSLFICDCCPKKPKKFDNPDDLRAHEMVKQYSCPYCNHRFKNKNEAERHRNHLHLRRYSWSCATLITFQAAFNASISPYNQTNVGPSHDMCGYCGEEFPNFPQADCNRRFEHLTTMHKFGECSNTKKFYRADHFRQHLKHSHAGTSGKWTDILETACMKEEHARASE